MKWLKKILWKIEKRIFCYWCLEEGKHRLAKTYGRFPIDADYDAETERAYPLYSNVGFCEKHLWDYENNEGVYERYE